jgi:hypothetical protein
VRGFMNTVALFPVALSVSDRSRTRRSKLRPTKLAGCRITVTYLGRAVGVDSVVARAEGPAVSSPARQNSDSPGGCLRDSSERPVATVHQARRKQHNRDDSASKSSFVPPASRTGLIARPHRYWQVLRQSLRAGPTLCRRFRPQLLQYVTQNANSSTKAVASNRTPNVIKIPL